MKLPTQIRYGTRALLYIACEKGGGYTQTKEISEKEGIPERYLEQIFQKLKKAGLVSGMRGPTGGYCLLKPPDQISIGDVVRAILGADLELVPCKERKSTERCRRRETCAAAEVWRTASKMVMDYFNSLRLDKMCEKAKELRRNKASVKD